MADRLRILYLYLDPEDWQSVQDAVSARHALGPIPDGSGTLTARIIAEVCRDWLSRIDREAEDKEVRGG